MPATPIDTFQLANGAVTAAKLGAIAGSGLIGGNGSILAIDTSIVATVSYVTGLAQGLDVHQHVQVASAMADLGATFSTSSNGSFTNVPNTIDAYTLRVGDRVLVKDQSTPAQNGIYVVTSLGGGPATAAMQRATDAITLGEIGSAGVNFPSGSFTFVTHGTLGTGSGWVVIYPTSPAPVINTTSLTVSRFSGGSLQTAYNISPSIIQTGSPISITKPTIDSTSAIALAVTAGSGAGLAINMTGSSGTGVTVTSGSSGVAATFTGTVRSTVVTAGAFPGNGYALIAGANGSAGLDLVAWGASFAQGSQTIRGISRRGTQGSPADATTGDYLLDIEAVGGTNGNSSAILSFLAVAPAGANSIPTDIVLYQVATGSVITATETFRFGHTGTLTGTSSSTGYGAGLNFTASSVTTSGSVAQFIAGANQRVVVGANLAAGVGGGIALSRPSDGAYSAILACPGDAGGGGDLTAFGTALRLGSDSSSNGGIAFAPNADAGFLYGNAIDRTTQTFAMPGGAPTHFRGRSTAVHSWTATTDPTASADTGISRLGIASLAIGNGAQGDTSGLLQVLQLGVGGAAESTNQLHVYAATAKVAIESTTNTNNAGLRFLTRDSGGTGRNGGLYMIPGTTTATTWFAWSPTDVNTPWAINQAQTIVGHGSGVTIGWSATANDGTAAIDTGISRFGAGIAGLSNSTNGTSLRVFNTTDSTTAPTNAEWFETQWSANQLNLRATKAGTGTVRVINIDGAEVALAVSGSGKWKVESSNGNFVAQTDSSYDIGGSATTLRPRNIFVGGGLSIGGPPAASGELRVGSTTSLVRALGGFVSLGSGVNIGWSSGDPTGVAMDTFLSRKGVSQLRLGATGGAEDAAMFLGNLTAGTAVKVGDGAAGTPSYSFTNNTDRGIYNDTVNGGVGFAVGGSLKTTIFATGMQLFSGVNLTVGSGSTIAWSTRSVVSSSADGMLTLTNAAANDFSRLQLGGTTSSFPAIRRNSAGADCVLADGSAYAMFGASVFSLAAGSRVSNPSNTDGIVLISNNAGTAFTRLQLGGTGNGTAAFRPAGAGLDLINGDASGYQPFGASSFNMGGTTFLSNIATGVIGIGTAVGNSGGGLQVAGTGATHGEILKIESVSELLTLSTGGTTTDTAANLLPAGAIIMAVDCRVTTTITTATNWSVGDATTAARFSAANSTLTSGTTSIGIEQHGGSGVAGAKQPAAAKVRITTTGTPGAGAIRITVHYIVLTAPTS